MPAPSALAMALGVVAIGVNLFLTSLVCNEISLVWNDLDAELKEIQGILKSVTDTIEKEIPKDRVVRQGSNSLDGESTIKSARITRRRLLNQLRHRNSPMYEIDGDYNEDSSKEHVSDTALRRKNACDCKSYKNSCPVGPPGPKGTKGSKGLNGPKGRKGYPGLPGPSLHKHIHIKNCAVCAPGPRGLAGKVGPQGAPGPAGPPGSSGAAGHPSSKGEQGPPGEEGPQGAKGKIGPVGEAGMPAEKLTPTKGEKGPPGSPGPQGPPGDMGDVGPPGPPNVIIGEPGHVGAQGRPGRAGQPGSIGATGSEGERVCECFVYLQQEEPNEPAQMLPIVQSRRADIRRAPLVPLTPEDEPVASQIYVEKVGDDVTAKDRKTLFYYNQSGQVNLSIAKGQSVAPPFVRGGAPVSTVTPFVGRNPPVKFGSTTTTEEPQRYRYLSDEEVASIPANIFAKRRRVHGARTFKSSRAFAIENDLLGIEKPKNRAASQKKNATLQRLADKNPLIKRKWGRFTRVFRVHKGPFLPLSRSSQITAHIARSRKKQPLPPSRIAFDNNVNKQ